MYLSKLHSLSTSYWKIYYIHDKHMFKIVDIPALF